MDDSLKNTDDCVLILSLRRDNGVSFDETKASVPIKLMYKCFL